MSVNEPSRQTLDRVCDATHAVYDDYANEWDQNRRRHFLEKNWIDRFLSGLQQRPEILDIGCGAGFPIADYLIQKQCRVTGVDLADGMLDLCRYRFPVANFYKQDMRALTLDNAFDGIIAWDSFFHLRQTEQRQVLTRFAAHLKPGGSLLVTVGHEAGEVLGTVAGQQVYHSSLAPEAYRTILAQLGFKAIDMVLQDPHCSEHSIILASDFYCQGQAGS